VFQLIIHDHIRTNKHVAMGSVEFVQTRNKVEREIKGRKKIGERKEEKKKNGER